jgi:methylglutaconyl-CoA hydratase
MDPRVLPSLSSSGIASIKFNNNEKGNAFDNGMITEIITHLEIFMGNDAARVILIGAIGKNFSTGADLGWMKRMVDATLEANRQDAAQLAKLMHTLWCCTKPVVARVQGAAFGGALGLIACADIVVAADDARFCLSEVKLGLAPSVISPYVVRAMGGRQASRYFITGEEFGAQRARELELVHEVVPAAELDETTQKICLQLMRNGPHAIRATKSLLRRVQPNVDAATIDYTTHLIAMLRVSQEGQEGMKAFLEKRTPAWLPTKGSPS